MNDEERKRSVLQNAEWAIEGTLEKELENLRGAGFSSEEAEEALYIAAYRYLFGKNPNA
jgi:hypothetical protein